MSSEPRVSDERLLSVIDRSRDGFALPAAMHKYRDSEVLGVALDLRDARQQLAEAVADGVQRCAEGIAYAIRALATPAPGEQGR